MPIPRHLARRAALLAAACAVSVAVASPASAMTLGLNLKGGYKNATNTACTQTNHYTYYHYRHWSSTLGRYVRNRVLMDGYLYPAPPYADGAWRVKIKVKKCTYANGVWRFRQVWYGYARGNHVFINGVKYGHYRRRYTFQSKGFFFARAYYYRTNPATKSSDEHFRVTR